MQQSSAENGLSMFLLAVAWPALACSGLVSCTDKCNDFSTLDTGWGTGDMHVKLVSVGRGGRRPEGGVNVR
ncbi:hypothetical protein AWZ03_007572, partial [Drosophila navojoa]